MVHEHLMSVMNAASIFDEYGHHEKSLKELIELYPVSYKKGCQIYFLFN